MSDDSLMAALDEAEQVYSTKQGCRICLHLDSMSEDVRNAVESSLGGTLSGKKLATILTQNGYPTSDTAIRRHRKGHISRDR